MKFIFILATLLIIPALQPSFSYAKNLNPEISHITPPALVECKSPETCDRNPQHLEQFVKDFYRWYLESRNSIFEYRTKNRSLTSINNKEPDLWKQRKEIINNYLTLNFSKWINGKPEYDNGEPAKYFCANDYDSIFCSLYIPDVMKDSPIAKTKAIDPNLAKIIINIPGTFYTEHPEQILKTINPYILSVWLEIEDGAWRISRVREWPIKEGGL